MIIAAPILDAISIMVPCIDVHVDTKTHVLFLPIMTISKSLPVTETVVCIGCDSHYGPNRKMFHRPYLLFIEYPSENLYNAHLKRWWGRAGRRNDVHP